MRQHCAAILQNGFPTRVAALALILIASLALFPHSASAHARLVDASPVSGSALVTMPAELVLTFSEEIDLAYSSASLLDSSNDAVALGSLTTSSNRLALTVPVVDPPAMLPGTYTLVWRVLSAVDGHVTTGTVAFSAGTGVAPSASGGAEVRPPWWRVALRWFELTGLTITTGLFAFALLIARRPLQELDVRCLQLGRVTFIATAIALLFSGYDLGITATGSPFLEPPNIAVYRDVLLDSTVGRGWLAIAICLAVIAVLFFFSRSNRFGIGLGLIAGLTSLLATSAAGHAAAVSPAWRTIALDWLHFAAVACWLGSLPFLWLTLRSPDAAGHAACVVTRFSRFGIALIGVIVLSGLLRAGNEVSGPRTLIQSDYGRVLIAKHLLFVAVLVAAGVNQLVLVPRIRRAVMGGPAAIASTQQSLRRFISIELAAAMLILVAAATLTELAPAQAPLPVDVAARPITINQSAPAGDLSVWLLARLEGASSDRYTITIEDGTGRTPPDLQRVIVESVTEIDGAVAGDRFDAEPFTGSPGTFVFPAIRLGLPGTWDLSIIVRRAGVEDVTGAIAIDTTGAGSQAPRLSDDEWRLPRLTIPAWLFGFLALACLIGGIAAVKMLRALEPFAAGIILTMTALITAGFAVQGYRQTVPVSAGSDLTNPVVADAASIQRGEGLYRTYCLECHAPDGRGINEENSEHEHAGTSLTDKRTQNQRDGDLFWSISHGIGGTEMPAYDVALSEQERWDLVNYLRALKDQAPATPVPDS